MECDHRIDGWLKAMVCINGMMHGMSRLKGWARIRGGSGDRVAGADSVEDARVAGYTGWREGVTAWQLGLAGGAPDRPGSRTAVTEV